MSAKFLSPTLLILSTLRTDTVETLSLFCSLFGAIIIKDCLGIKVIDVEKHTWLFFVNIVLQKKMESLLQKYDAVCQMNSERNLQLERAQSLVNQFWETYEELWPWLTETEMIISQLPAPALEYETLKQQQEEHRVSILPVLKSRMSEA